MQRYVIFKKYYKSKYANYKFIPTVKYAIKNEDINFYYTIKNVKLHKNDEFKLYEIFEAI